MSAEIRQLALQSGDTPSKRLDKEIFAIAPPEAALSRSRIASLIRDGWLSDGDGNILNDPSARAAARCHYVLTLPQTSEGRVAAEDIPLEVLYEDESVIVVNKSAGMVVHPAPGAWTGTLVSALLFHCGDSLSGIGGEKRPGIVHRLDKETSGVMVAAKTDQAHHALSEQFAAHTVLRQYRAFVWGVPDAASARLIGLPAVKPEAGGILCIDAPIDRHRSDRKKMAVVEGGRRAVTRVEIVASFTHAAEILCRLETGRTHQIRVHLSHVGHGLIGDPTYGRGKMLPSGHQGREVAAGFPRQALHAEMLGFVHPRTHEMMHFETELPGDMRDLQAALKKI